MTRGKKIFAGLALVFAIGVAYISYDISKRTTFPGSKPQLRERIEDTYLAPDTSKIDSVSRK
jgi:hypothetical protein